MFDPDLAIAEWRRYMAAGGIKSLEVLDELESHLRDEMDQRARAGLSAEPAFEAAIQRIGRVSALQSEFKKACETTERKQMKRTMIIVAGVIGILIGMAWVMPAVAQYQHEGAMTNESVGLLLLGMVLTLGGAGTAVFGFKRRNA